MEITRGGGQPQATPVKTQNFKNINLNGHVCTQCNGRPSGDKINLLKILDKSLSATMTYNKLPGRFRSLNKRGFKIKSKEFIPEIGI